MYVSCPTCNLEGGFDVEIELEDGSYHFLTFTNWFKAINFWFEYYVTTEHHRDYIEWEPEY